MTSSRERQQRATARTRLAQQMAERQAAAQKRRQRNLIISSAAGAVVLVLIAVWAVTSLGGADEPEPVAANPPAPTADASIVDDPAPTECVWTEVEPGGTVVDVGAPPEDEPREGTQVMTVSTSIGEIQVEVDVAAAPCVAASFTHLASQEFYDGTKCHRMFPGMLQCGDPTAKGEGYRDTDGTGGPSYRFGDENLPVDAEGAFYPAGTVAMANSGPSTNGSQFFFIYEDTDLNGPNYSVIGTVIEGMDVFDRLNDIGHDGAFDPSPGGGHPNEDVIIESLRMSEVS